MQAAKRAKKVVERAGELPAVPEIVNRVLQLTADPSADMSALSDVVQQDPALTAKILKISNSAYYGLKQHVGSLKLALVVIGLTEMRNIVLGISVFDSLRHDAADAVLSSGYYKHSLMVGAIAKKMCRRLALESHGEAFVSGVLHDIGKLVLVGQMKAEYSKVLKEAPSAGVPLYAFERERLGFSHADAAAALALHWDFPSTLSDSLWLHHPIEEVALTAAKDPLLAAAVRISDLAAHADWNGGEEGIAASIDDAEAWECLEAAPSPIPEEQRLKILEEYATEVEASSLPLL